jgi:hypothetical protein
MQSAKCKMEEINQQSTISNHQCEAQDDSSKMEKMDRHIVLPCIANEKSEKGRG